MKKGKNKKEWIISRCIFFILVSISILSCGGGGAGGGGPIDKPQILKIYVSSPTGSDDDVISNGSEAFPYKTITHAIAVSESRPEMEINIFPGTYDLSNGEIFPIKVTNGIKLITTQGGPVTINGTGKYLSPFTETEQDITILIQNAPKSAIFSENGKISLSNNEGSVGIWIENSSPIIHGIDVLNNFYGIVVVGDSNPRIEESTIDQNRLSGIELLGSATSVVRANQISGNSIGINIRNESSPNLGTDDDFGKNKISDNTDANICNQGTKSILAIGNIWDIDPFLFSATNDCSQGTNIGNTSGGAVFFQEIPPDIFLFPNRKEIILMEPKIGEKLGDNQPKFVWSHPDRNIELLALFNKPIKQVADTISNPQDMIWAWHTGLKTGTAGSIRYVDGIPVINGKLSAGEVIPLEPGRTYYWAVWAWDNEGIRITDSSKVSYFTILN